MRVREDKLIQPYCGSLGTVVELLLQVGEHWPSDADFLL